MGILLFVLSNLLGCILLPFGILYGLFKSFYQRHFNTGMQRADKKLYTMAASLDKYANVVCAEIFNDIFITSTSEHPFGKIEQTISAVLGHNLQAGTLTRAGRMLNDILDFIDPGHTLKAIGIK